MTDYTLKAEVRDNMGKGASRRLRRLEGQVPAIVYGGDKEPLTISLPHKDLSRALEDEAFYSHIITIKIGRKSEKVILKDLQRHPAKPIIVHADFLRVSAKEKINVKVPLHFLNAESSKGVKLEGGSVITQLNELEVSTLPKDLPEFIEVDLQEVGAGDTLHISDVVLPKGVESVALSHGSDHDLAILTIKKPKGAAADDSAEAEGEEDAAE
ncbi:50S ribosomal protein L25/general stress protein Ctc [Umboniibacter marinipuniceus]|uniref:Large ribosomal subunit protein bL25 n=1 Tax=Umboniibacter marinipuniceus TaxID=569599 RepID=A0A3M0AC14_9GAMM|nr:50S ribosomal protein L25/general stress protein Ctc [Umboniibacter marinipuniceus]RMA79965.1 large subunit ribosomal protein L25 [Umboniibacter marinipuniceus]